MKQELIQDEIEKLLGRLPENLISLKSTLHRLQNDLREKQYLADLEDDTKLLEQNISTMENFEYNLRKSALGPREKKQLKKLEKELLIIKSRNIVPMFSRQYVNA